MSKARRFRVIPQEQGLTLRNLLVRRVRELDRDRAAELIRAGGVYVNRLRVRLPQVLVAPGERVTVYLEALIHELEAEGVTRPYVGVVHRLDRGASGLVMFTIRSVANKSLHQQFREHRICRGYRIRVRTDAAWVPPSDGEFRCELPLIKLHEGGVRIGEPGDSRAKPAVTHFRHVWREPTPLADGMREHLLDVRLETGRTHQIRAHAASLGCPVVGDHRYGRDHGEAFSGLRLPQRDPHGEAPESGHDRLCLHAWTLDLEHPRTGAPLHLESPLPDWARVPTP